MENILKLSRYELDLVEKRYPDIRMDELLYPAAGMATVTYLDFLMSHISHDLESGNYGSLDEKMALEEIRKKGNYNKNHSGRNYVRDFDPDANCAKADKIARKAFNDEIGDDMYKIDQLINYIRGLKDGSETDQMIRALAVNLGTKLGEMMLKDGLLRKGFDWERVDGEDYPCLVAPHIDVACSPIIFIYKKLLYNSSSEDMDGTCSDFYYIFQDTVKEKEKRY